MKQQTHDEFLGGRLEISQYHDGHRSGTDAVLLAASINLESGQKALELGCGAGVASLCLASRVSKATVHGVDIDPSLVELARSNAQRNALTDSCFHVQDIHEPFSKWELLGGYDHVFANPPFYRPGSSHQPPDSAKQMAHIARSDTLKIWVKRSVSLVKAKGCVTFIHRVDALPDLLAEMGGKLGGLEVLPLSPKAGQPAKRLIVRGWRDSKSPLKLLAPLVLHENDGGYRSPVEDILRHGATLNWKETE